MRLGQLVSLVTNENLSWLLTNLRLFDAKEPSRLLFFITSISFGYSIYINKIVLNLYTRTYLAAFLKWFQPVFYRATTSHLQHEIWYPSMVFSHGLESFHFMVLQGTWIMIFNFLTTSYTIWEIYIMHIRLTFGHSEN